MSAENIQAFFLKVKADEGLQRKMIELQQQSTALDAEGVSKLATEAGTPFTAAEFLDTLQPEGELSDASLRDVAGGMDWGEFFKGFGETIGR